MGLGYDWKGLVHFFTEEGGIPCTVLSHQWRKTLLNPLLHVIYSIFNIQLLKKFNDNLGFQTRTMLPPPFCHSGKKIKKKRWKAISTPRLTMTLIMIQPIHQQLHEQNSNEAKLLICKWPKNYLTSFRLIFCENLTWYA